MKSTIFKTTVVALFLLGLSSCSTSKKEESHKTGKEYTSTYVCPMHCEGSGAEEAGQCPVCGMDYTLNDKKK